jgi:hypothetical protein
MNDVFFVVIASCVSDCVPHARTQLLGCHVQSQLASSLMGCLTLWRMRHFELFFLGRIQQLMALPQARQDNHHHRCRLMLPFFGTPLSGAF